jgi:endogenous inhibitor of DNA gyrase (YacG/DUF329 family)
MKIRNTYHTLNGYSELKEYSCIRCGDDFKAKTPLVKYCSDRCLNDSNIQKRSKERAKKRSLLNQCQCCSVSIEQSSNGKLRKYCSNKCKQKAYRVTLSALPILAQPTK